ncbi:hypothetical protein [Bacillus sp. Marseille-P3661]|nr:hypothetical protein [Bacillus sp. Marseille-P3661]
MINEEYEQLVRNNDRGTYLKGTNKRKNDTNPEEISGPVLVDENNTKKDQ